MNKKVLEIKFGFESISQSNNLEIYRVLAQFEQDRQNRTSRFE